MPPLLIGAVREAAARSAASSIVAAGTIRGCAASARIRRPSSAFVPSSRTTSGTVRVDALQRARARLAATRSHRVMPPKMLMNTALTAGSDSTTSSEVAIWSALAPPPTSRKFAA